LAYIYAVLHSPAYRLRYAQFLKVDFPRIPTPPNLEFFETLATKGAALIEFHLLESSELSRLITRYPVPGDNLVDAGYPKYLAPGQPDPVTGTPLGAGRVYLSSDDVKSGRRGQYFDGVPPEVWEFQIGGYQVCEKWLKDHRERTLSHDDLIHYEKIVAALAATTRLMTEIDAAISAWPIS